MGSDQTPEPARQGPPHAGDDYTRTGESEGERLDRNWRELLQELRVTQTGVQILTGFLLAMPLQQRFTQISVVAHRVYIAAVILSVVATTLLIAPVSMHRIVFRLHRKETLVAVGNRLAKIGLAVLALAVTSVAALIFTVVVSDTVGLVAGGVTLVVLTGVWAGVPLVLRGRLRE